MFLLLDNNLNWEFWLPDVLCRERDLFISVSLCLLVYIIFHTWWLILLLLLKTQNSCLILDYLKWQFSKNIWQFDMNFPAFDACSCIFFGHGWMASWLHPLIWSSARGFPLVLPSLAHKLYIYKYIFLFVTFYELFQAIYLLSFSFLFSLLLSSLSVCISPFLYSLLSITATPLPVHVPCPLSHPDRPIRLQEQ